MAACVLDRSPELGEVILSIYSQRPCVDDAAAVDRLRTLCRQMQRGVRLRARIRQGELADDLTRRLVTRWPFGVVMLNPAGDAAAATTGVCNALAGKPAGSSSFCHADCARVQTFVRTVRNREAALHCPAAYTVQDGNVEYIVVGDEADGAALILLFPEGRRPTAVPADLRRYYGFTEREAEVAIALVQGSSAQQIAERRQMSLTTVRTHIRHLLRRTGTTH